MPLIGTHGRIHDVALPRSSPRAGWYLVAPIDKVLYLGNAIFRNAPGVQIIDERPTFARRIGVVVDFYAIAESDPFPSALRGPCGGRRDHSIFPLDYRAKILGHGRPIRHVDAEGQIRPGERRPQRRHAPGVQRGFRHQHEVEIGGLPRGPGHARTEGARLQPRRVVAENAPDRVQVGGRQVNRSHRPAPAARRGGPAYRAGIRPWPPRFPPPVPHVTIPHEGGRVTDEAGGG